MARIFIKSESGIKPAICCFAIASPCFHSFHSFFHSISNNFSRSENVPETRTESGIGSFGAGVPSTWWSIPRASSDHKKRSLKITQLEPETSSLGTRRKSSPSLDVDVDIVDDSDE